MLTTKNTTRPSIEALEDRSVPAGVWVGCYDVFDAVAVGGLKMPSIRQEPASQDSTGLARSVTVPIFPHDPTVGPIIGRKVAAHQEKGVIGTPDHLHTGKAGDMKAMEKGVVQTLHRTAPSVPVPTLSLKMRIGPILDGEADQASREAISDQLFTTTSKAPASEGSADTIVQGAAKSPSVMRRMNDLMQI